MRRRMWVKDEICTVGESGEGWGARDDKVWRESS